MGNDPVNYIDPLGLNEEEDDDDDEEEENVEEIITTAFPYWLTGISALPISSGGGNNYANTLDSKNDGKDIEEIVVIGECNATCRNNRARAFFAAFKYGNDLIEGSVALLDDKFHVLQNSKILSLHGHVISLGEGVYNVSTGQWSVTRASIQIGFSMAKAAVGAKFGAAAGVAAAGVGGAVCGFLGGLIGGFFDNALVNELYNMDSNHGSFIPIEQQRAYFLCMQYQMVHRQSC